MPRAHTYTHTHTHIRIHIPVCASRHVALKTVVKTVLVVKIVAVVKNVYTYLCVPAVM